MKRTLVALAVGAVGAIAFGAPALATEPKHEWKQPVCAPCTDVKHWNNTGILLTTDGEVGGPASNGTAVVKSEGVEVTTPDANSKVLFLNSVSGVKLAEVAALSYKTWQLNTGVVALPSYQLVLDYNGSEAGGFTTLVYEPYMQPGFNNTGGAWKSWDSIKGGNALWWSTKVLANLPNNADQGHPQKWSDILAKYPNATVTAYGFDLGKGSAGAQARINELKFGTVDKCVIHKWTLSASPAPSASPSTSGSPSPKPSTSASPSTSVSHSASPIPTAVVPAGGGGGSLPVTGPKVAVVLGVGAVLVALGIGLVMMTRRRNKPEFVVE